uniref:Ent-kaurenoic acid oxidase n=1 Tax=Chenopodium quinoa TaxID=63459 RepID=A0A803NBE8_CHEQI
MFGNPSVIVTIAETCRKVLNDDEHFKPGWPVSTLKLIGTKSFVSISYEEHKRLRRLTSAPINGHEALSEYIEYIEDIVKSALENWCMMGEIEFLTQLRKLTFKIIMYIFLSSESEPVIEALEREYTRLNYGVRAMAINIPGFAYHEALKARKKLVAVFQSIIDERRALKRDGVAIKAKKDMMDALLEVEDENGRKLTDEEIIDLLVMYLNAGHESSGHTLMWATVLLQKHPEFMQKAKAEQEEIVKNMPAGQKRLTLKEFRQMTYLSQVVDETLRWLTFSLVVFREALSDVKMNGYTIPKGWKVLVWFRTCHLDPETWPEPLKFNPSRWDGFIPRLGTFLPFGAGAGCVPEMISPNFGKTGIYKAFMFGSPSIIVTTPEICRKVLNDDEHFKPGWPLSTTELIGRKSFIAIPFEEHKRLRKLTAAPINGHEALSNYIEYIEDISITTLDKLSTIKLQKEYTTLNHGVRAMAINIPGFAYHRALKAEQEEIIKNRPAGQKGLTLKETRKMTYLSQVVDETLRWVTFSFVVFREAISDFKINGYTIPKGWRVLTWFRTCHLDPEVWPEPMKFNPSRWDDLAPKAGTFLPFGAGSRLCPGNDLAKLEISIFLHHFLLNYRLERTNPSAWCSSCPIEDQRMPA